MFTGPGMALGGFLPREPMPGGVGARMAYSLLTAAITFTSLVLVSTLW